MMKNVNLKFRFGKFRLANFHPALIALAVASMALMNNAHARNQILTGTIEAQYVCHDGANRGATIRLLLSRWTRDVYWHNSFADLGAKTYYAPTTCYDLMDHVTANPILKFPGKYIYAWYTAGSGSDYVYRCKSFKIRYANNGKQVWVQNGGTAVWNMNCVAKDGL